MRIVLLEGLGVPGANIEALAAPFVEAGHSFAIYTDGCRDEAVLCERVRDAEILIVANSPLPAAVVDTAKNLKFISVAFTGVDHLPMELCHEKNITVSNCAGYSTQAVAELAFGLMLSLARRMPACDAAARAEKTKAGLIGFELAGKTLGIVGTGAIGMRVAQLGKAFGMELIGYSRTARSEAEALGMRYLSLDEVMAAADIVSLHLPANAETKGIIGQAQIEAMKPTALLINTARGAVLDSNALARALNDGKIAGAGIDVFETEPPIPAEHPLCHSKNTILTPHVAFATDESMVLRAQMAFENVRCFLAGASRNLQ